MEFLIDVMGWVGSIEVLAAFGLNTWQKIKSDSISYLVLNITGSIFLIIYSYYHHAFANTFVNLVWAVVAVVALGKILKR
jgi:hypothetical protein